MLTVAFASATAALFGISDFLGGFASRRESAIAVTASAHGVGVVLFALALAIFPAPFSRPAVLAGVSAGLFGGIGVAALYAALARGRMSVIAPLTAALSGSLPAIYDFVRGSKLSGTSIMGLALAFTATVIVSATSGNDDDGNPVVPRSALALALLAGVGFAGSFLSFSFAPNTSGYWPLFAARGTSFVIFATMTFAQRRTLAVRPEVRPTVVATGLLDSAANVTMLNAIRLGPLAVASVLGSLYPVVTVLLARAVLGERLKGAQRLGVALALAAVLLAAWR